LKPAAIDRTQCFLQSQRMAKKTSGAKTSGGVGVFAISGGVWAERRRLKIRGKICGGLPTRRYGAGESSPFP
jgi:hypothetical protein